MKFDSLDYFRNLVKKNDVTIDIAKDRKSRDADDLFENKVEKRRAILVRLDVSQRTYTQRYSLQANGWIITTQDNFTFWLEPFPRFDGVALLNAGYSYEGLRNGKNCYHSAK